MEKMKNVIFWDNDINERKRAMGRLKELGYCDSIYSNCYTYGIGVDSRAHSDDSEFYDNPTFYNSAAEFIEALEEFHKPKMRDMTRAEIVKTVSESELKMLVYGSGTCVVEGIGAFSLDDMDDFYHCIDNESFSRNQFINKYKLLIAVNEDGTLVTQEFKIEDK